MSKEDPEGLKEGGDGAPGKIGSSSDRAKKERMRARVCPCRI